MEDNFDTKVHALIEALQLGNRDDVLSINPLTGGVSSEISVVTLPDRQVCAKFALAKLKVAAEWHAPVRRNLAEYRWLEYVSPIAADNVPKLYGHDDSLGGFAMEFLAGEGVANWKAQLLKSAPCLDQVTATAQLIARVHSRSTRDKAIASRFDNMSDFEALRIEPYLESLRGKHPDLSQSINAAANFLRNSRCALIHGDVSPKNILFRGGKPILLDAECATMGDPVFDVAFCTNHFLLKAIYAPHNAAAFAEAARCFADGYTRLITWEDHEAFNERLARLLPILFLARVDGKSPVEYLDAVQQSTVREIARHAILNQAANIAPLVRTISRETV